MKITVIYGTQRKSCTYNIARQFVDKLSDGDRVDEFFLPKDAPHFCRGCFQCFTDYTKCPDFEFTQPILESMNEADLLVFTSPVYVYHVTGQMKAFLDHFGFRWMVHQPNETMFHKQALVITAAAGGGTKSTAKDIKDSMDFWGVAKTHSYRKNTAAASWEGISPKKKAEIETEVEKLAQKIKRKSKKVKPSLKVKGMFLGVRFLHKKFGFNEPDVSYWRAKGWLENKRPW